MKLRVTIEFDVKETERGFDVNDSDGFCICFGATLQDAVDDLKQMTERDALNEVTIEVIDVLGNALGEHA